MEDAQEAPVRFEGTLGWSARQLQQLRTRLGNVAFGPERPNTPGWTRAAATQMYELTSNILDEAARKSPASEASWTIGNDRWSQWAQAFLGKNVGRTFQQSPLAKVLVGQNADEIMGPLTGADAQNARTLLRQFRQYGYNEDAMQGMISRHSMLRNVQKFSQPSKFDLAMAATYPLRGFVPGYGSVLSAYALTRLLGPTLARWWLTRGIDPLANVRGLEETTPGMPRPAALGPKPPGTPPSSTGNVNDPIWGGINSWRPPTP